MCGFCMYLNRVDKGEREAEGKREEREGRRNLM